MLRASNVIIAVLNLATLFVAAIALTYASSLYMKAETSCERTMRLPLVVVGGAMLGVSIAGLLGACCRVSVMMWLYLIVLFLAILGLMVATLWAAVLSNPGMAGDRTVGDYSTWLNRYVMDDEKWDRIKTCLVQVDFCATIESGKTEEYYKRNLTSLQSGCCKPPNYCEMQFKNGTTWDMPPFGPASPDLDCLKWSNDQRQLCFDCESCKMAALGSIRRQWRTMALATACISISLSIIYSIGCCALRNNQKQVYNRHSNDHHNA